MKFKTFRTLFIVGVIAGAGVLVFALGGKKKDSKAVPAAPVAKSYLTATPTPPPPPTPTPPPVPAPASAEPPTPMPTGDSQPLRDFDSKVLALAKTPLSGEKLKDAFPGTPQKVSLYQDAGNTKPNRAKVDLNRNEKWDEKWTFSGDEVKREIAPADDEKYVVEYRLRGGVWVKKTN